MKVRQFFTWTKFLPYWLTIAGIFGLLASFALTYEKIQTLEHPGYKPSCNLNPVLSCQSVMSTPQAEVFGVPNPIFGLIAFSMLLTLGILLIAGVRLRRRLWLAAQIGATAGVIFMHYLFFESVYKIHAICPWCFGVWMVTIPVFWGITIFNIRMGYFGHVKFARLHRAIHFIDHHAALILASWYVVIFAILLSQFWYYWSTLL